MKSTFFVAILITTLGLISCNSQKKLVSDPPFTVERPTVSYWAGGREESGTGMQFQARWNPRDPASIRVDSLYFRGRMMKLTREDTETGFQIIGMYRDRAQGSADLVMHADSLREVGNQPPRSLSSTENFPFDLRPDEAVISYQEKSSDKKYYHKITGVVEKAGRIYPERTKN